MWTKNSSRFLPLVLRRIEDVIPSKVLQNKIIIDDHSTDNTIEVAKSLGWNVHKNRGNGISDAFETALSLVSSEFFVSVEHDIILSKEWWRKIPRYMKNNKVAVAQGVRVGTNPVLRKIDEYIIERMDERAKPLHVSIDNNLYRTGIIRKFGTNTVGGPMHVKGFKWIIDLTVVSDHIRPSIRYLLEHDYEMHKVHIALTCTLNKRAEFLRNFELFLLSPFRALHITLKKKCPQVLIVYPLDRLAILKAYLEPIPKS
jgi:glycosyltransferase involved in cell wall biosynthesis